MRLKKPTHVLIDQVRITREGNDAIIDHADANLSGARITRPIAQDDRRRDRRDVQPDPPTLKWALLEAWDKTVVGGPAGREADRLSRELPISGSRAAAYALVGVAVATALVPPLATAGILLARADFLLGGALLLAATNVIAIQFAFSAIFG